MICALPLATDPPAAKAPRKAAKAKTPAPGCDWPLATEAAAIIEAKATTEPTPEPELAPEAPIAAPALDPVAAKRERETIAQRLRRAAAKASVQWRGDAERTAAAE